jgi:anti-anti-sigma factor
MGVTMPPPTESGWEKWDKAGFRVDVVDGCVAVAAYGDIDMDSSPGLDHALRAALRSSPCVILDLTQVSFMDSSGLGVLVGVRQYALTFGGSLLLVQPPPAVRRILVGTQLQQSFAVFDSMDEALQASGAA